ncbi:hypothetical protein G6F35_014941 [Rhizopus arrhizus]|nr:hypothetical protein G6F35_014941 [Rhizopus arrhizus]
MGPYATQILADLGADVIKVEPPSGDNMRAVGPMRNPGMGHLYLHLNRNKRSIVLDLKTPEGLDACLKLAESCDALLYNIRPQAMARLGLSYEAVAARNPRIVYLGAYGFGEAGPYAGRPAYDDLIQGQTGIAALSAQQSGDVPRYAPLTLADRARACTWALPWCRRCCTPGRRDAANRSRSPCSKAWRTWCWATTWAAPPSSRRWARPATRACWRHIAGLTPQPTATSAC